VPILVVAGLTVGLINITSAESSQFLTASIALVLMSAALGATHALSDILNSILKNLVIFVSPAALWVSTTAIWRLAKTI